jgi:SAM-dependent methyltransferase
MAPATIPIPPLELRQLAGPTDVVAFENYDRKPVYAPFDLPVELYDAVFDFGCGCGRVARQLLLQHPKPRRYIGIDLHRGMIDWCRANLTPVDPAFQFLHHDVYSPAWAPRNTLRLAAPFPVGDGEFSLVIAHSVFTHLTKPQTEFYLGEIARVLAPGGVAYTSWFFFDNGSFPFPLEGPFALYTSETDFSQVVVFDRAWFLDTLRRIGLSVRRTELPSVPGHQWKVFLATRTPESVDRFPMGREAAEWLCGAPVEPSGKTRQPAAAAGAWRPPVPPLFGPLALFDVMRRSRTWRIGRLVTAPWRLVKRAIGTYDDVLDE